MFRDCLKTALFLSLALTAPASAESLLFVFQQDTSTAQVYDAGTLRLVASPSVGLGAVQAFAIADPADATRLGKYYVVGANAVVALAADFSVRRTLPLGSSAASGRSGAALSPDGKRLLVAAGDEVLVIDTSSDSVVARLNPGFSILGVAVAADGASAYVIARDSGIVRTINLRGNQFAEQATALPTTATAIGAAANGSHLLAATTGSVYDLGTVAKSSFQASTAELAALARLQGGDATPWFDRDGFDGNGEGQPTGSRLSSAHRLQVERLVVTNSGTYFLHAHGRFLEGTISGAASSGLVRHPVTGLPLGSEAVDLDASPDGGIFLALVDPNPRLIRFQPGRENSVKEAHLPAAPTAIALVSGPVAQAAGSLQQVSGNNATIAAGGDFTLVVKAVNAGGAPVTGAPVFVGAISPSSAPVECFSSPSGSDGNASIYCASDTVEAPVSVEITVNTVIGGVGVAAPPFTIQLLPPSESDGLFKVSGDGQSVLPLAPFQLVVRASENHLAQAGLRLTVTLDPGAPTLQCLGSLVTANDGLATIPCTAGTVEETTDVEITVTDEDNRSVAFNITIDPEAFAGDGLVKLAGDNQVIAQGTTMAPMVVGAFDDNQPQEGLRIRVIPSPEGVLTCPLFVFTEENGEAPIVCRANTVFGDQLAQVFVRDDAGRTLDEPFRVTVSRSAGGIATIITVVSDALEGVPGETIENGFRVRAINTNGAGVAGVEVFFWADAGAVLENESAVTDGRGFASTSVTLECGSGSGRLRVGFDAQEEEDSVTFATTPGPLDRIEKLRGDNQTGTPGQALNQAALLIAAVDVCGTPLENVPLAWTPLPSDGVRLRNVLARTNRQGQASALAQLGDRGGPVQVRVTSGLVDTTFNLTVLVEPAELRVLSGDGQPVGTGQFAVQPLVVEVRGSNGLGVSGVAVTFDVTQGSATLTTTTTMTDALGLAYTRVRADAGGQIRVTATAIEQDVSFTLDGGQSGPTAPLDGFVNGASFQEGWAPGSLGSIFVSGILDGIEGVVLADGVPFPTTLEGLRVTVDGEAAPLISLVNQNGLEQINLQVPFGIEPGTATVVITRNAISVTVEDVPIRRAQPGIFEYFLGELKLAAALHADFRPVTPDNPARPGEIILLFLTGLGPTDPVVGTNVPGPSVPPAEAELAVTLTMDGNEVQSIGEFYAPELISAFQINFRVPANTQSGNRPISVTVDSQTSQTAFLPVERE